jgi:hypothetical protein
MGEPKAITGQLHIGIRVAPTGEPCVFFEWPDGSGLLLSKGQALTFAFTVLATVRNLFRNVEELETAVIAAKAEADTLTEQKQTTTLQ